MKKTIAGIAAGLAIAGLASGICIAPDAALAAGAGSTGDVAPVAPVKPTPQLSGWQKNKTCYYKNGVKVTGIQKIGKAYYYFNAKGTLKKGTVKSGGYTYYTASNGKMEAYKKGSTFYKPTGVKMPKYSAKEYQSLLHARKQLKSIVKAKDSKSAKMYKCMKWVNKGYYEHYRSFKNVAGWTSTYANDHFVKRSHGYRMGDCVSDPCAFAYLCLAAGLKNVAVGVDYVYGDAHATTRVNGKFYDPLFAEAKSWSKYYGYKYEPWAASVTLKVPSYANGYSTSSYAGKKPSGLKATKTPKKAAGKTGLVKEKGALCYYSNGKKAKSKWVVCKGASYYFDKSGKAVTGSVKVKKGGKKAYYVFAKNHKLAVGKGTRVMKIGGVSYRVSAKGKASSGWDTLGTNKVFYLENGALATGPCLVNGKLSIFSSKGVYDAEKSQQARALLVREAPVGNLIELLGGANKVKDSESCFILVKANEDGTQVEMEGTDRAYAYDHLRLSTFIANGTDGDGLEYFMSIQ